MITSHYPLRSCRFRHPERVPESCPLCRHYARLEASGRAPPEAAPAALPGSELTSLLASLGLHGSGGCGCASLAARMDAWGVAGCRERREEILAHLREKAAGAGWLETLKAGYLALSQGLLFDPLDPAPGLLDEALRRAEAKEVQR